MSRPRPSKGKKGGAGEVRRGALRVVSGTAGGLRLDAPPGDTTRPTSDRVREAVFNALDSLGVVEGARVLDAFAGSGALGIEALSRGAAHATFVEADPVARGVVAANVAATNLGERASLVGGDGLRHAAAGPFDLILLDPPYDTDGWDDLLASAAAGLAPGGIVVVESDRDVVPPPTLYAVRVRRYGSTVVTFLSTPGAPL